jgi:chromosome segregation ATPase
MSVDIPSGSPGRPPLDRDYIDQISDLEQEIDDLRVTHRLEISRMQRDYEERLKQSSMEMEALRRQLSSQGRNSPGSKDGLIQSLNFQIDKLAEQCQSLMDSRSADLDRLSSTLERLENVLAENDRLRMQLKTASPFPPPAPVEIERPLPKRQEWQRRTLNPRTRPEKEEPPVPIKSVRHVHPQSQLAFHDQIVFNETKDRPIDDICNLKGMTAAELEKSLEELEKEKSDLGRRIAKVLPPVRDQATFGMKLQRENDEKEYDTVSRMIARIKLELRWKKQGNE